MTNSTSRILGVLGHRQNAAKSTRPDPVDELSDEFASELHLKPGLDMTALLQKSLDEQDSLRATIMDD